jgi:hypothetical protein
MGIFRKKVPDHLVPIHAHNIDSKDWIILLEAGTIVGPSPERLRVARATQERRILKKHDVLLRAKYFLVIEGYNPRIHAVYFCPQLYRYDADKKLVPLHGEEIGRLIAQSVETGVAERRPWYEPAEKLPDDRIISTSLANEFESMVVELPASERLTIGPPR